MRKIPIIITVIIITTIIISTLIAFSTIAPQKEIEKNLVEPIENSTKDLSTKTPNVILTSGPAYVTVISKGLRQQENGSGFYISPNIVVTCNHVLQYGNVFINSKSALVVSRNSVRDIALVKTSTRSRDFLKIAAVPAQQGQRIITIGNPMGLINSMSDGIVSNDYRLLEGERDPVFQFTAPVSHGSSGGAVLNDEGEVVGMVKSMLDSGQSLNFAVPADQIQEELNKLNK